MIPVLARGDDGLRVEENQQTINGRCNTILAIGHFEYFFVLD